MSLKQIAEMVGTSVSTVSRVLNNSSSKCASKELQERIWTAAHEIGYRPNEAARVLQCGGSQKSAEALPLVTVVMARSHKTGSDPFFETLLHCLKIELYAQGALLHDVVYAEEGVETEMASSNGVIVLGRFSQTLLDAIRKQNQNIVGIWCNTTSFKVDEVVCDGKKAAELAMEHLIGLGHKSIAYIGDCSFESRYVGYCNTLIQHNIPINYSLIRSTDQTFAQGQQAILELLEGGAAGFLPYSAPTISPQSAFFKR